MIPRLSLPFVAATLLAGCPGGTKDTTPTGETDPTVTAPEPTGNTGQPPEEDEDFPAKNILFGAEWGWDGATNSVRNATVYGNEVVSRIEWVVATDDWLAVQDYSDTSGYCVISWIFPEGPYGFGTSAAKDTTAYFGIDHSGLEADFFTNCGDKEHNIGKLFGSDIAATMLENGTFGMAIGNFSDELLDLFDDYDLDYSEVVGARVYNMNYFWSPIMTDDLWFATPLEVDPKTGEALVEDGYFVLIDPKAVYNGAGIATAWYRMSGFWYILFGAEY